MKIENFNFTFDPTVVPFQYEKDGAVVAGWPTGSKVVDVVANQEPSPPPITWLIEAKDFRIITKPPKPSNLTGLASTVDAKVRSSIAALPVVAVGSTDAAVKAHAAAAATAVAHRVVLHLEPHPAGGAHSLLFPLGFSAAVLMKLKQLVKDIDPNPMVLDIQRTARVGVPWSVV